MAKLSKILKFGYGVLDDLGFFSPTEKAIDALGQDKFPAKDLYRLEDDKPAGLLSKFGRPVQDEMVFTGLEDKILGLPEGSTVTSKELKDYLADNKTRVNEVIKSDKVVNKEINYEPFEFSVIEPVGPGRGRYGVQSFLNDIDDGVPSALEAFAELDVDSSGTGATRLGTFKNPLINKINFEDLSTQFQTDVLTPVVTQARQEGILYPDDFAMAQIESDVENLVKFEFSPTLDADKDVIYRIQGNNTIGYEVTARKKGSDANMFVSPVKPSFNEAKLTLDGYRRKVNKVDDESLEPKHEQYTLPGGKNYQEIILKMPEPPDSVATTLGKFNDVVFEDRFGAIINLRLITGSPSDTTLDPQTFKKLKEGNKITIDTNKGTRDIRYNKETDQVELLKTDYKNYNHTGDEKNVVVFTRTKDRVDEDGRKILYVEEIQSDMSQQGRKRGLVMGQKEKKAFINRNNNVVFGDVLDSINALKDVSNISDLKGIRASTTIQRDFDIGRVQPAYQKVGFRTDYEELPSVDYDKAHSFEDIIKKHMTKYKFNELKDKNTKILTNQGFNKKNIKEITNRDTGEILTEDKMFEKVGFKIPTNLYDDVTDFVDVSKFKDKIDAIETVMANKIYTKEFNKRPDISSVAGKAEFDKLQAFNRDMLKKFMGEKEFNRFIKEETDRAVNNVLPFYITETPNDMPVVEFYKSIGDDDIIDVVPDSAFNYRHSSETPRDRLGGIDVDKLTKAEFNEKFLFPELNDRIEQKLQQHITYGEPTKNLADGFDYSENAIDEVYDKIKDLQTNLGNAVRYDVKLRPVGNIPSAPFIGSTERFTELAVKRLLKHAKDNDYDGVAFSSGKIHEKRWNQPTLKQYYDVIIPKVAKNLLKGTDAKLEYTDIFLDQDSLDEAVDLIRNNKRYDYYDRDVNTELDRPDPLLGHSDGFRGYIGDAPTIYLTDDVKEYVDSGISLYTPITATGLAGAVSSKMLGSEEDIITEEGI